MNYFYFDKIIFLPRAFERNLFFRGDDGSELRVGVASLVGDSWASASGAGSRCANDGPLSNATDLSCDVPTGTPVAFCWTLRSGARVAGMLVLVVGRSPSIVYIYFD